MKNPPLNGKQLLAWAKQAQALIDKHGYRPRNGSKGLTWYTAMMLVAGTKKPDVYASALSQCGASDFENDAMRNLLGDALYAKADEQATIVEIWASEVLGHYMGASSQELPELIRALS
jgi:hypothetical protein